MLGLGRTVGNGVKRDLPGRVLETCCLKGECVLEALAIDVLREFPLLAVSVLTLGEVQLG